MRVGDPTMSILGSGWRYGVALGLAGALMMATGEGRAAGTWNNLSDELQDSGSGPSRQAPDAGSQQEPAAGNPPASAFVNMARKAERAVGLVVLVKPIEGGGFRPKPMGTAWAFAPNLLATNSHISEPVREALGLGIETYVVPNKSRGKSYRVVEALVHPRYDEARPNVEGRLPATGPYDIGVLRIEGAFDATVPIASEAALASLDAGTPVAFIGFPMENLIGDNVSALNPIATMQVGNVTSVSDYYLEDAGPAGNFLVRHNLPATGGASGSPIFLADGSVAAVLNAGNIILAFNPQGDSVTMSRAPSAAGVNYAQRIDILRDLVGP